MNSMQLIGYNTRWYRHQNNWTQEQFAEKTGLKMAYISTIETGSANLTCRSIDLLSSTFGIEPVLLFNKETAELGKNLPKRVDMNKSNSTK